MLVDVACLQIERKVEFVGQGMLQNVRRAQSGQIAVLEGEGEPIRLQVET